MIEQTPAVNEIAHLISLAIAPVFLLAGIGSILNVLAARLARVVDRARRLAILFVADLASFQFGRVIAYLFILTMVMLIAGLLLFLYEVRLAMRSLRIRR